METSFYWFLFYPESYFDNIWCGGFLCALCTVNRPSSLPRASFTDTAPFEQIEDSM